MWDDGGKSAYPSLSSTTVLTLYRCLLHFIGIVSLVIQIIRVELCSHFRLSYPRYTTMFQLKIDERQREGPPRGPPRGKEQRGQHHALRHDIRKEFAPDNGSTESFQFPRHAVDASRMDGDEFKMPPPKLPASDRVPKPSVPLDQVSESQLSLSKEEPEDISASRSTFLHSKTSVEVESKDLDSMVKRYQQEIETLSDSLERESRSLSDHKKLLSQAQSEWNKLRGHYDDMSSGASDIKNLISSKGKSTTGLLSEIKSVSETRCSMIDKIKEEMHQELTTQIEKGNAILDKLKEYEGAFTNVTVFPSKLSQVQSGLDELIRTISDLDGQVRSLKHKKEEQEQAVQKLREANILAEEEKMVHTSNRDTRLAEEERLQKLFVGARESVKAGLKATWKHVEDREISVHDDNAIDGWSSEKLCNKAKELLDLTADQKQQQHFALMKLKDAAEASATRCVCSSYPTAPN